MRYCASCPTCHERTTIHLETLTPSSQPMCLTCGAPLRLSTEAMQNTPLAEVWLVPQGTHERATPECKHLPCGLSPARQAAFEALLRRADLQESELAGSTEL